MLGYLWINSWYGFELRWCGAKTRQSRGLREYFAGESCETEPRDMCHAAGRSLYVSLFSVSLSRESFKRCGGPSRDGIPLLLAGADCIMDLASDVAPLLSKERADEPGGLWATKQYGDLKV